MSMVPQDGWYYGTGPSNRQGPVTLIELQDLVRQGVVRGDTQVWATGLPRWARATEVPTLGLQNTDAGLNVLIPMGPQSVLAILAGYCGLLTFLPGVGLAGFVLGMLALRDLRANRQKRGMGRGVR